MVRYLSLEMPSTVQNLVIEEDLGSQIRQRELFRLRVKLGPEVIPAVFQPVIEPAESLLRAIFIAPGENHLVFLDEIAPMKKWDEWYRGYRIRNLGRSADIESLEITDNNQVIYHWCHSLANLYESGMHYSGRQSWTGTIYSSTWNHMMSNKPAFPIQLRGGYRKMEPEIYNGDRDAAEEYAKKL